MLFNLQTGGTLTSLFGNLGRSYYGIDNRAYLPNLIARVGQLRSLLAGRFPLVPGRGLCQPLVAVDLARPGRGRRGS